MLGTKKCPKGVENDELDYSVHFLFDDTNLADGSFSCVCIFLKNEAEAIAVSDVCRSLEDVFDKYGYDKTDSEYIGYPEWDFVMRAAAYALTVIDK